MSHSDTCPLSPFLRSLVLDAVFETNPFQNSAVQLQSMMDSDALTGLPPTTRWYRLHGRPSREAKAVKQQYLSPQEEKALAEYMLRMAHSGYPLPIKSLRSLAQTIRRQRGSTFESLHLTTCLRLERTGRKAFTSAIRNEDSEIVRVLEKRVFAVALTP